jgi:gag-polyprotein putative aspartyl protease
MGMVYAKIELVNSEDIILAKNGYLPKENIRRMTSTMLVDSGAYMMAINQETKAQLGLKEIKKQKAQMANGDVIELGVVGPIKVYFENRDCTVDAFVLPGNTEELLGAIPMEYMAVHRYGVLIHPQQNALIVNPAHPNVPQLKMK